MGSCTLIMLYGPDQNDELGVLDGNDGRVSPRNKSSLTAVLDNLTVQLEYFDCLVQSCTL